MIVSASRRTDIPAFHGEWFMNRVRSGYALVRSPGRPNIVDRVPLDAGSVDMIVFSSKDPGPMMDSFAELRDMGYATSFQITVNPYGRDLEPRVPPWEEVAEDVRALSRLVGPDRVVWRYDPVVSTERYDAGFHREAFSAIASELRGSVLRCSFSFLSGYGKLAEHMASGRLGKPSEVEREAFVRTASSIAHENGMRLTCCSGSEGICAGVEPCGCIDPDSMRRWGIPYRMPRSPVRPGCGCVAVADVGMYDTCLHDCIYCYANSADRMRRASRRFDPEAEMLSGHLREGDEVRDASDRVRRITDF